MEKYILILLTILVSLVIVVVYYGYRQLNELRVFVNRNTADITAIQSLLNNQLYTGGGSTTSWNSFDGNENENENESENDKDKNDSDLDISDMEDSDMSNIEILDERVNQDEIESEGEAEPQVSSETITEPVSDPQISETISEPQISEPISETISEPQVSESESITKSVIIPEPIEVNEGVEENIEEEVDKDTKIIQLKKNKRLVPNLSAKKFEVGYKIESENDGKMYEVVANKNGAKRWKIIK